MQDDNVPYWGDLSDEEKAAVDGLGQIAGLCENFSPDRVILFYAYFTEIVLETLSKRVVAAREMHAQDILDPRLNVAGMVLSTCMNEIRDAYDAMFNDEALAMVNESVNKALDTVDLMMKQMNGVELTEEQLRAFVDSIGEAVDLDEIIGGDEEK